MGQPSTSSKTRVKDALPPRREHLVVQLSSRMPSRSPIDVGRAVAVPNPDVAAGTGRQEVKVVVVASECSSSPLLTP